MSETPQSSPPARPRSVRQLAQVLSVSKTRAAEIAALPGFPPRGADGCWDAAAVLAWRGAAPTAPPAGITPAAAPAARVRCPSRNPDGAAQCGLDAGHEGGHTSLIPTSYPWFVAPPPPQPEPPPPSPLPLAPSSPNPLLEAAAARELTLGEAHEILAGSSDPLLIARAAVVVCARDLGKGEGAKDLKGALEELRRTESDALELAVKKGTLIDLNAAKAAMGEVGSRFVRSLNRVGAQLAMQVDVWFGDPKFRELASQDRARVVRTWFEGMSRQARTIDSDEMEKIAKQAVADGEDE